AKGKIPIEELNCLMGVDLQRPSGGCQEASVVHLHWILSDDGAVVKDTSEDETGGGDIFSIGEADRAVAEFKAQKGHHYRLDFDVLADGSSLDGSNPHLQVSLAGTQLESSLVLGGLLRLFCGIMVIVGAFVILVSLLVQRRESRRAAATG
ncbi:MAG TPA: hypothetical protein VGR50_00935, partial [Terriglobales bacterium]|nr:hypothetical protein [Terriglobales bacterium]